MECILLNKQYVGKAETRLSVRLNNHRKDVKTADVITACGYFQQERHNFNKHATFTITNQLANTSKSTKFSPSDLLKEGVFGF